MLKARDIFLKGFKSVDYLNFYGSKLSILNASQKYNESIVSVTSSDKIYTRSTAFASAVKKDEPSGIRCVLQWSSNNTAQPTLDSSFDPPV